MLDEAYIGVDENAIGVLAGPLSVGAVFLQGYHNIHIKDSKRIKSVSKLYQLGMQIEKNTTSVVRFASVDTINALGTWKAWERLVNEVIFIMRSRVGLTVPVVLDGIKLPRGQFNIQAIPKADINYPAVSAASIISKMRSRQYMYLLGKKYPEYGFGTNCGYGSEEHIEAIINHGVTKHHRIAATNTAIQNRNRKRRLKSA